MSTIGGKKREQSSASSADFTKKVGLFEAEVIAVNPNAEEYKDILGMELKEDSKVTEYLGTSQNGNKTIRIDFWLEEVKSKEKFKVTFFLEDLVKVNKDATKTQYINAVGMCSWADDPNNLYEWFTNREYRPAFVGEEDLYNFLRTWLGNLDLRDAESTLQIEWKKLMNGNVRDIKQLIGGEFVTNVVALATIKSVIKDDETKEYQSIYNKAFLPAYTLKNFRLLDYSSSAELGKLRTKKSKELKPHERFVLNVTGEYGCKDYYTFKDLKDYNPDDNLVASDKVIAADDMEY
jgi:hypothetical protein